jgi:hypothetical protein
MSATESMTHEQRANRARTVAVGWYGARRDARRAEGTPNAARKWSTVYRLAERYSELVRGMTEAEVLEITEAARRDAERWWIVGKRVAS